MILHVNYLVPVVAVVDTIEGTVDQVVVVDEEIRLDPTYGTRGVTIDAVEPASRYSARKALAVAEHGPMWPSWEFGF
jgi:hypothetical protein